MWIIDGIISIIWLTLRFLRSSMATQLITEENKRFDKEIINKFEPHKKNYNFCCLHIF